jgi:hypothetical protein
MGKIILLFLCSFMLVSCTKYLGKEDITAINLNQHGFIAGRFIDTFPHLFGLYDPKDYVFMRIKSSASDEMINIPFSYNNEITIYEVPIGEYRIMSIIRVLDGRNQEHKLPDELLYPITVKNGEITYIGSLATQIRFFQAPTISYTNDYVDAKSEIRGKNQNIDPLSIKEFK